MAIPKIDKDACTGCGECVEVCPTEAISMAEESAAIDDTLCIECGACLYDCPADAISEEQKKG